MESMDPVNRRLAAWLRPHLEDLGFAILAPEPIAAPMVLTLQPPPGLPALALGEALEERNVWVSYRSGYLLERNLLQVCLMGEHHRRGLEELLVALTELRRSGMGGRFASSGELLAQRNASLA